MRIFGFEIIRKREMQNENTSFVPPDNDDGAVVVSAGGFSGQYIDLDGSIRTEAELVTKYRDMAMYPDVDMAVDEIVNESICVGEDNDVVKIILDDVRGSPNVKTAIEDEFQGVLRMLQFNRFGHDLYKKWYIDGRLYFHEIVDPEDPLAGIKELRYIDPRKIRKVREITKKRLDGTPQLGVTDATVTEIVNEYYVYNENGFVSPGGAQSAAQRNPSNATGLKIAVDSIIHVTSGITDSTGKTVLSYLHKAIKPLNQLKTLEDSTVVYRLVRAPERRVWKIDVGNLPKTKADQYMQETMVRYKNRLVYDASTGEVRDDRKYMTMLEDIWLPTRGDARSTTVDTLPSGELTGVLDDVLFFQKKLYNALNVPMSRLNSENIFTSGRATEVTREEVKFAKFIYKIRVKFCELFLKILERQLILKNKLSYDDWVELSTDIKFDFVKDNYFAELKDLDILQDRLNTLAMIDMWGGKYYSHQWIRRNVLKQTDEDIEDLDREIADEADDPQYHPELLGAMFDDPSMSNGVDPSMQGGPASMTQDFGAKRSGGGGQQGQPVSQSPQPFKK